MNRFAWATALVFILGAAAPAQDGEKQARAILDKGVKALGGEANLKKFKAYTWKVSQKPTYRVPEDRDAITVELSVQFPDRFRRVLTRTGRRDGKSTITLVVDGAKGWYKAGGETRGLVKEELANEKEDLYLEWVLRLYPLRDKQFKLQPLGETKVKGKDAVGLKVSCKGRPDVRLYFDKGTGLPVKCERPVQKPAEKVDETIYFEGYQEAKGIKWPVKRTIFHGRHQVSEERTIEFAPAGKLGVALFAKP
jgi:hypothetical protein